MNTDKEISDLLESVTGEKLSLGAYLKAIRMGEEMTQEAFSALLGISRQCLCDIEKSRRLLSPKLAANYAEILGYSKKHFICLSLQDMVDKDNLDVSISVDTAA